MTERLRFSSGAAPRQRGSWRGAMAVLALLLVASCSGPGPTSQAPGADGVPSSSAPLALSQDGRTLWVVNPDADSVTPLDTKTLTAGTPLPVGAEPWVVAVTPSGEVVVLNRGDGTLTALCCDLDTVSGRIGGTGGLVERRTLYLGPEPAGLALSPSGRLAYVTLSVEAELAIVDLESLEVVERLPLGASPWAVAVTDDGDELDDDETVVVAHRFARPRTGDAEHLAAEATDDGKEGWLTLIRAGERREVVLGPIGFGFPNTLESVAFGAGGAWVAHQLNSPEYPRDFETTVSAALSAVGLPGGPSLSEGAKGLVTGHDVLTLDVSDESFSTPVNFPRAVALAPDGSTAYLALAGTDAVMGIDLSDPLGPRLLGFWPTGSNPRGLVVDADGARGYVMNYLSRDVSVLDLSDARTRPELARVPVAGETLDDVTLRGKVLFNNATDPRISHLGWISCASCHPGGAADGTTWLTPDGPRQTMPLWRLAGTAPFHASATRDEVQDFEHDIEGLMAGSGLAPGVPAPELGAPNAGRSYDLDALAHFVLHGIRTPVAAAPEPHLADRGRELFSSAGCSACHGGAAWTVSSLPGPVGSLGVDGAVEVESVLVDVGTFDPARDVLGERGFDVPSLLGIAASAPYLHDGSAATLGEVLDNPAHAPIALSEVERAALVAFLRGIDERTAPVEE